MFIPTAGAAASTLSVASTSVESSSVAPTQSEPAVPVPCAPIAQRQHVRHLLFGTLPTVQATIRLLHQLGYAEVNDWSRPISTGRPNEVMAILTKRVVTE
ncbi:MAG: hypothetical protein WA949_00330 [Phormidesmis sp.]